MAMTIDELKRTVFPRESGGDYDALYGFSNRPGGKFSNVKLTDMTVDQALAFANPSGVYGQWVKSTRPDKQYGIATPMGAFQIVGTTLRGAKQGMGLTGNERMTPEMQDKIATWIYNTQGPSAWSLPAGGGTGGGGRIASSSGGTPAMGLMDFQQSPEPQTFKERLQEGIKSGALWDNLALAFNSMRLNPDQGIGQIVKSRQEQRAQERTANRTAQWLMSQGREDLARALLSGAVDAKTAAAVALTPPADNRTALMQNYEYAISQGMTPAEARQWVSSGTTIQMPGQPTIGTIPAGYQAVKDETGSYRFEPIPGGPAETEVKAQANTKQALIDGAADSIDLIDSVLRDPALPSITGMVQGAMPPLTQAGTDLNVKIEQLKGQTFLRAFESLKGGGAITEREGAAAQAALARLNRAQSTAAYMAALTDLRTYLDRGRRRLAGENIPDAPLGGSGGITVGAPIE